MSVFVAIAAVVLGLVLGGLGGGGSILAVPTFVYLAGYDEKTAIAMSLVVVAASSLIGLVAYAKRGEVAWKIGLTFGLFAMIGASFGGWVAQFVPGAILMTLFAVFMVATSVAMLRPSKRESESTGKEPAPLWLIALEGVGAGAATGLVGAGGGFIVVPALVLLGGLEMRRAIGTSLFVIVLKSISAFAAFSTHIAIDFQFVAIFTGIAFIGVIAGQFVSSRIPAARLRTGFATFVLVMAVFVLTQQFEFAWTVTLVAMIATVGIVAALKQFGLTRGTT